MRRITLICCIAIVSLTSFAQSLTTQDISKAIECLQPGTQWERDFLRLRGNSVAYQIAPGGIPDTSEQQVPFELVTVVFYSQGGTRAIVSSGALTTGSDFLMLSDEYHVKKVHGEWRTDGGQGGLGMYQRVSRFVHGMEKKPKRIVTIHSINRSFCIAEADWNVPGSRYISSARRREPKQ